MQLTTSLSHEGLDIATRVYSFLADLPSPGTSHRTDTKVISPSDIQEYPFDVSKMLT